MYFSSYFTTCYISVDYRTYILGRTPKLITSSIKEKLYMARNKGENIIKIIFHIHNRSH